MLPKRCLLSLAAAVILLTLLVSMVFPLFMVPSLLGSPYTVPPSIYSQPATKSPYEPSWWNTSFRYRTQVNFTETDSIERVNNLVDVYLTFDYGTCYNGSIVVPQYRYNESGGWMTGPIPCQVWNTTLYSSTSYLQSATVTFYVNVTAGSTATYYIYYNDSAPVWTPSYPDTVNYTTDGNNYIFNTTNYDAYCSLTAKGGKLYNCYNKISGTWWTNQPATSNGFHWNPDYPNYDSTSRYPPLSYGILADGPLFVMYTTLARLGGTVNATTNITYRFFEWGWICETNSTFYQAYGSALYRNNEWVFNDKIMPTLTYKTETGQKITVNNWWTQFQGDIGKALWLAFYDTSDREAMGTMDLITPVYSVVSTSGWSYRVWQPSYPYYEYWDRAWPNTQVAVGSFIYERFANYMWNGTGGLSEFETFANMMERDHALTINVNATQEKVFFDLNITVTDPFSNPLTENVTVTIYNTPWSSVNESKSTDSLGKCNFQLFENDSGYWIEANLTTPYLTYVWRADYAWIPGVNSSTFNIEFNVTKLYLLVQDFYGTYVQKAEISVNYTNATVSSYNISSQPVDPYLAQITLYVYANQEVNITINTTYGAPPTTENFSLWNMNESKPEGTPSGLGQLVQMNSSKYFLATLNRSIGQVTPRLECANGTFFNNIYWNDSVTFVFWIKHPNGQGIDADWMNFTVKNSTEHVLYGPVNMTKDPSTTGKWSTTFDFGTLYGGQNYFIVITAEPSDTASYTYPAPLTVYISPLNNLPLVILPSNTSIIVTWNTSFSIGARLNDTHNNQFISGAPLSFTISPGGLSGTMNETSGNYSISYDFLRQLNAGTYTVTLSLSWDNYTASPVVISLEIESIQTVLEIPLTFQVYWGENLTIYAIYNQTSPEEPVADATLIWRIKGTEYTGSMTYSGGSYTSTINTTVLSASSYTIEISASKTNYEIKEESAVLNVLGAPTILGNTFLIPPIASLPIVYLGPYIHVENSVPLTPIIFYYHTPGPHSPLIGANVTLQFGTMQFTLTEVMPGVYLTFIPTFNLPPGNMFGVITASFTNYQTQQSPIFLSVGEASIFIPIANVRVPKTTFLLVISAVAIPTISFTAYAYIKRARIPAIVKRIDELITKISRGEKITVKPIPRIQVVEAVLRQELAVVGIEPKEERYVPVELEQLITPLLVESGMNPDEAHTLILELKKVKPTEREKLLESVGVPGEISAQVLQMIEEEEERREALKKPIKKLEESAEEEPTEEEVEKPESEDKDSPKPEPAEEAEPAEEEKEPEEPEEQEKPEKKRREKNSEE
ncbi:MAG: hypothetical protein Q6366_014220 [Candidatus Freyarchaeota archaeon]